ncbi:nitroreductase family protein [Treponema primitia]|nr:nitroreductase family protein [Treponema primitia]
MNETLSVIKNRRSIRDFKPEQIKGSELEVILEAGMYAPSSGGHQPWHFTVIQNKKVIGEISEAIKAVYREMPIPFLQKIGKERPHLFYNALPVIVISGDQNSLSPDIDCALAGENMLIAAESLNIGSVWVSGFPQLANTEAGKQIIKALNIPEGYKPIYSIALGYKAAENPKAGARRENLVNYIT